MFCLRKNGNFKGRLPVNRLTLKKTKSFQYQKFSWLHVAKNRLLIHYIVYGFRAMMPNVRGYLKKKLPYYQKEINFD
jgi:hypothetical protein